MSSLSKIREVSSSQDAEISQLLFFLLVWCLKPLLKMSRNGVFFFAYVLCPFCEVKVCFRDSTNAILFCLVLFCFVFVCFCFTAIIFGHREKRKKNSTIRTDQTPATCRSVPHRTCVANFNLPHRPRPQDQPHPRPDRMPNPNPMGGSMSAGAVRRLRRVFWWRFPPPPKKIDERPKEPP